MKTSLFRIFVSLAVVTISVLGTSLGLAPVRVAHADTMTIDFDSYSVGTINAQDGWSSLGAATGSCALYDHAVVNNTYGYASFGAKSLRISNAVTSGCFGDQTFSKPLANEAGETSATNGGLSGGTRQPHFEAQFSLASTVPGAQQPGLSMSVSPDRGDGARMSYLRIEDKVGGLAVFFDDVQQPLACTPAGCANFVETQVAAGLDRSVPHTLKFSIDFVDGPSNDVVRIYVDGALAHVGGSWEDYFRNDPEAGTDPNTHTVDSLIFRTGGPAVSANAGKGFLIDNLTTLSGPIPPASPIPTASLDFNPTAASVDVGGSTTVNIDLNSVMNLYGYQFQVNYDSSKLSAVGAFVNSFFDTTADAFTSLPGWNAACVSGVCKFAVSKQAAAALSGSGTLAKITFTGVAPGSVPLTLSSDILGNRDGAAIPHTLGTASLTVNGSATLSGMVKLQGRPTPGPGLPLGTVTLTTAGFAPTVATIAANGAWSAVVPVAPGGSTYQLDAAHSLYLGNRLTGVTLTPGGSYAAATTKLLGGDADNSGKIDISDLTCIGNAFGGPATVCGATGSSDINADSVVNILDLVLAGGNFDLLTPQGW